LSSSPQAYTAWTPTSKRAGPKGFWASALSALAIEFGVVALIVVWVIMHPPEDMPQVIPLVMSMMDAPKDSLPKPPEPAKLPVLVPKTKTLPPVAQVSPEVRPVEEPAPPVLAKPNAFSAPPPQVQPATVALSNPAPQVVDPAVAYNLKLAAAVQAAFVVPGPAAALGFKGRARVEFHLKDGAVSHAKILQASGLGAVDRAALKAVEVAVFPVPPSALLDKEGVYQIWVACF
jgi:TonB family protein